MSDLSSLVLKLSADVATWQGDMGKIAGAANTAADKISAGFDKSLKGIGDTVKEFAAGLIAAFAVDKMVEAGRAAIDLGDQFSKMSQKVGVSVESLSSLRAAAQLSDVSFEDLGGAMEKLARTAGAAAGGSKAQAAAFDAIGVSVKDANGQLKPMQDILTAVSAKFAGYTDSAAKTALAQDLFGKSGANLIPLLNQLGTDGFDKVTQSAKDYGQQISGEQAKQSEEFNDNLTRLGQAASGFALAVVHDLLPSLVAYTNDMADAAKTTDNYSSSASVVSNAIKGVVLAFTIAKETVAGFIPILLAVGDTFGAVGDVLDSWASAAASDLEAVAKAITGDFDGARASLDEAGKGIASSWEAASSRVRGAWSAAAAGSDDAVASMGRAYDELFGNLGKVGQGAEDTAEKIKKTNAPIVASGEALKAYSDNSAAALLKLESVLDGINAKFGSPYQKAISDYNKGMDDLAKAAQAAAIEGVPFETVLAKWQQGEAGLTATLVQTTAKIDDQLDISGRLATSLEQEARLVGTTGTAHEVMKAIIDAENEARKQYEDHLRPTPGLLQAEIDKITADVTAHDKLNEKIKLGQQTAKEWQDMWVSAGSSVADTFAKVLVEGGSLMDGLVDIAKQVVEQIISQFLKLQVINPILNQIFGGQSGFSLLAQGSGGMGGGSIIGSILNMGGSGDSSGFSFSDPSSWYSAGKNLWSGFAGGQAASAGSLGDFTGYGTQYLDYGSGGFDATQAGTGASGGGFSLGQGLSIAGGVYAGYNEYNQAGGGVAGVAGAAAYGVGTYFAGTAAAAALSGGLAAGLAAIPVVGWIALAAMLIDKFSGGKLFGTAAVPTGGWASITHDTSGSYASNDIDMKGQGALFSGAEYSQEHQSGTPEQNKAAKDFFDAIQKGTDAFAKQFGLTAGIVAAGSFSQKFDKNGKLTGETTTHINGQEYNNETQAQFAERIQAQSFSDTLAAIGVDITKYTADFIKDADAYSKAVQDAAGAVQEAQYDIKHGTDISGGAGLQGSFDLTTKFNTDNEGLTATYARLSAETKDLANGVGLLTGQGTIADIEAFLATAQQFGETLSQTYQRLQQAGQQYTQFVAQFKAPATYADPFQASLAGIDQSMKNAAAQANALAKAAGLEGASTKDLANIHAWAAAQFAQAVKQLKIDANSLASNLGYALSNNLDQINAQISAIQGSSGGAAASIGHVSDAMQSFTERAKEQINLLLGDLSPLNDQQKLQKALAGQQAGTVTPEQVLEIARRLMGSGSDYNAIFAQVMAIGDRTQNQNAGGGAGGSAASGGNLAALIAQRDKLEAEQRKSDAHTLAQQIADIVSSTGETIQQALTDVGITDLKPFMKDLGITDQKGFEAFIESLESTTDSANETTAGLADDIQTGNSILQAILETLQGTPVTGNSMTLNVPGTLPGGRTGYQGPHQTIVPPRGNRQPPPRTMGAR